MLKCLGYPFLDKKMIKQCDLWVTKFYLNLTTQLANFSIIN
jgi:hypothetical protein